MREEDDVEGKKEREEVGGERRRGRGGEVKSWRRWWKI